jgi:AsmA family protein
MKAVKIVGGIVVVLVLGVVGFLLTFDVSQYKGLIQEQAKAATGREIKIGDIKLSLSLNPAIVVSDVSFANATWGSRPEMVTAKRIEASTQLLPLLQGNIQIAGLKLVDADITLEVNKDGKANWEFDTPPSDTPPPALSIPSFTSQNLKLAYRDAKTGQQADVALESLLVKIAGDVMKLEITDVDLANAKVDFKDATQTASVQIAKLSMDAKGPITALGITALDVSDAKINQKGAGAPLDLNIATAKLGGDGALNLDATYAAQPMKATGTLAPLAELAAQKRPIPAKLALEAMGLKADIDITADVSKKVPSLKGTVNIPTLDLAAMAPPAASAATPVAKPAPGTKVFPDDPLPWDMLGAADADLKVSIGSLKLPNGMALSDVVVPVKLDGGQLVANGISASLLGGKVTADLGLGRADKRLALKVNAQGFTAENLSKEFKVTDLITNGPVDLVVEVRGNGNSVRAIMAGLNGSVIGGMGESRIRNDALNIIGADVIMQFLSAINPMGNKDPYTVAKCAVVNFQITNGIANTDKGLALVTDKMEVVSTGKVDLAQEQLDLAMRPKATSGISVGMGNLTQSFKLAGPLTDPRIAIDAKGAVKALGTLGAAFATGGASLLAQGVVEKTGAGDPCEAARTWHQKK